MIKNHWTNFGSEEPWGAVEELADAVATVVVVHEEAVLIAHVAHPIADVSHIDIRLHYTSRTLCKDNRERSHCANSRRRTGRA